MPYLQPATNNYFGFMPTEENRARTRVYMVSSSEGTAIFPGDVIVYTTDKGTVRVSAGTTAELGVMVGVAASRVGANEGSTLQDVRVASTRNLLVYDDPHQLYVGCDTTSGVLGVGTGVGKSYGVIQVSTAVSAMNDVNRSRMALSGVTASSGSGTGYVFRVVGLHPIETAFSTVAAGTATSSQEVRKWIVQAQQHVLHGQGDLGHVTT